MDSPRRVLPPFLFIALIMLFFFPNNTATLFAWTIKPAMTPLLIGRRLYLGSYFFIRLTMGGKWHWYTNGFLPIAAFTWFMALSTIIHWAEFNHNHISFYAWLVLYLVTPILVPILWLRSRGTDPVTPEPTELIVPAIYRQIIGVLVRGWWLLPCSCLYFRMLLSACGPGPLRSSQHNHSRVVRAARHGGVDVLTRTKMERVAHRVGEPLIGIAAYTRGGCTGLGRFHDRQADHVDIPGWHVGLAGLSRLDLRSHAAEERQATCCRLGAPNCAGWDRTDTRLPASTR